MEASRICVSSLCKGHANLLCIVPVLVYVLLKRAQEILYFLMFTYLFWERESMSTSGRWAERERERERERIPSRLHAVSTEPNAGVSFMNHEIMSWAKTKNLTFNQLSHPGSLHWCCKGTHCWKNKIIPFAATWMELEGIMLSEISQSEKDRYPMFSLICGCWET